LTRDDFRSIPKQEKESGAPKASDLSGAMSSNCYGKYEMEKKQMRILIAALTLLLASSLAGAGTNEPGTGNGKDARTVVAAKTRFSGVVEIYVTDWCGYCKKAINYMKSHDIRYVAYDVEKDDAARERHRELGGRGVPLIIIGSNKMSGFSAENLEYYLDNSQE